MECFGFLLPCVVIYRRPSTLTSLRPTAWDSLFAKNEVIYEVLSASVPMAPTLHTLPRTCRKTRAFSCSSECCLSASHLLLLWAPACCASHAFAGYSAAVPFLLLTWLWLVCFMGSMTALWGSGRKALLPSSQARIWRLRRRTSRAHLVIPLNILSGVGHTL